MRTNKSVWALVGLLLAVSCPAAIPPAEKLLPQDTLAVLAVPDANSLRSFYSSSPQWQMWQDAAMKPFRDKLTAKFNAELVEPLEKQLGIKLADYADLAQGQFTVAWVRGGSARSVSSSPIFLLIMDAKDQSKILQTKLADLHKRWADANKPIKTDKIRGVEFHSVSVSGDDFTKVLGKVKGLASSAAPPSTTGTDHPDKSKDAPKMDLIIGQSGSLLIVGNSASEVEKVLIRQSGGSVPGLDEEQDFQSAQASIFRDAPLYFWLNLKPIVQELVKMAKASQGDPANPQGPDTDKLISALGLRGLRSAQVCMKDAGNGKLMVAALSAEETGPQGLLKMFAPEAKETRPPDFVPADAVKYSRYRLDLQKTWNSLEKMLREVYPPVSGAMDLIFKNGGKDKDPNYDLRKELVGNLGDDLVSYQKAPKSGSAADLASPPFVGFIASPNGERFLQAVKTTVGLLAPIEFKERELLGRKIYSTGAGPSSPPGQGLNMGANAGYVALSTSPELVEEFIRSSDQPRKPLREMPGLSEAADKVGGLQTGLFGYDNETESLRNSWDFIRKNSDEVAGVFMSQLSGALAGAGGLKAGEWADFSLLPPFEAVSKYLSYSVYAGTFRADGITLKVFYPDPPGLKK